MNLVRQLEEYRYALLFPLAVIEGPVVAIVAGMLTRSGWLNANLAFATIVAGDLVGDSLTYGLGFWAGRFPWVVRTSEKIKASIRRRPSNAASLAMIGPAALVLSKLMLGAGVAGVFTAGQERMPLGRFWLFCLLTSLFQYSIYFSVGLLYGSAYQRISQYVNITGTVILLIGAAVLTVLLVKQAQKKI